VPNLSLVVNGGQAGVRTRPFALLPPGGLRMAPGQRALGLTVEVQGGARYRVSAADPGFARTLDADGATIGATLADIKKHHPGKQTIVIQVGDTATVGDVVALMALAQGTFPRVVLAAGQRISIG
jgi:hypothetical protein